MRVHHLNCGTMRPFGGRLLNESGDRRASARLVCHCLLIETDEGLILVDTGIGTQAVARPKDILGRSFVALTRPRLDLGETAVRQIAALGHTADDVRHIVLTHLDVDHAGGLTDFPEAQVHVHVTELEAARRPVTLTERERYRTAVWSHRPRWVEHHAGGERWHGFEAVRGLPGGLLLVPLAGHTRGHAGVAVDTGDGWLLHAGDAYYHHRQVESGGCPVALCAFQSVMQADRTTRLHNVDRLRELARADDVTVFSAHDPVELERRRTTVQEPSRRSSRRLGS
ncbi:MBL fold metallo-hydrolase [Actinoallomurus purpureus]|uniref:MBL fold metallo-hydrolase n=1 Tax=Actinoallomurus purpureus TaxID=478114 RepID=UPI0020922403|nr:MBL fold metallo-hydrolase [Actinoallomurus purpureus]MCO6009217.1 MBL fold metallo-hydrolase [Actinoallomurus purpureus]